MKRIRIKSIIVAASALMLSAMLFSCKEEPIGQTPTDSTPPGPVTNPVATPWPGGAIITYDLPKDNDLLYVQAEWVINGVKKNATASLSSKSLLIEGFGSTDPQTVTLYAYDRSKNKSQGVEVTITPETPPVDEIYNTLAVAEGFGGVVVTWDNKSEYEVTITVTQKDSLGEFQTLKVMYTSAKEGREAIRGLKDEATTLRFQVRDRWDNFSEVKEVTATPWPEEKLDKSLWKRPLLTGDNSSERPTGSGGRWNEIWDDNIGYDSYNWWDATANPMPFLFTIDLGQEASLSRYVLFGYMMNRGQYAYGNHHNPKIWTVWGASGAEVEAAKTAHGADEQYWKATKEDEGWKADWHKLVPGECISDKPSGMESGTVTQADKDRWNLGFEFEIDREAPPVRYVRFHITEQWSDWAELIIGEITFWGRPQQ